MGHRGYRYALLLLASALLQHIAAAQDPFNSQPLRVTDPTTIEVLIESLGEHAATIGLTKDRIRDRIEIKFLRNGINYADTTTGAGDSAYLYVNFNIIPNAASVTIRFSRIVYLEAEGGTRPTFASVWDLGAINSIGELGPPDADFLLDTLDISLDAFLADFLRDNQ